MVTKNIRKAWLAFRENKRYIAAAIIIEIIFLILFSVLHVRFFLPMTESALNAGNVMQEKIGELSDDNMYQLESFMTENADFMMDYHKMLQNLVMFLLNTFLLLVLSRTLLWYIALKSIYPKMPFKTTLIKFPLLSLFWAVVVFLILVANSWATEMTVLPMVGETVANILTFIAVVLAVYFAFVGFALIPAQQTFKKMFIYGIKHAKAVVPAMLINLVIFAVTSSIPFLFLADYTLLGLALFVFVSIPGFVFIRLHTIAAVWMK